MLPEVYCLRLLFVFQLSVGVLPYFSVFCFCKIEMLVEWTILALSSSSSMFQLNF